MTTPAPDEPERRVLKFRRGNLFAPSPSPPPSPVADLDKYERSADEGDDYRHRMTMNGLALLVVVLLIAAGIWIADTLALMRKNQDCVLAGRRNCIPEVPIQAR